jgi:hypothetical protein
MKRRPRLHRPTQRPLFFLDALTSSSAMISLRVQFSSVAILRNLSASSTDTVVRTTTLPSRLFFVKPFISWLLESDTECR